MEFLLVLLVVLVVVAVVSAPLRRAPGSSGEPSIESELAELEAEKEAKYHEIRDAELDHRTGKLSREDFEALDASLRGEAIELLRRIDAVRARAGVVG